MWRCNSSGCGGRPAHPTPPGGAPAYYTSDWEAAGRSVHALAALAPEHLATGHGRILHGQSMRDRLSDLATRFGDVRPQHGRYVRQPAIADARGVVSVPPPNPAAIAWRAAGALAVVAAGVWLARANRR